MEEIEDSGRDENGRFTAKNLFYLLVQDPGRKPKFETPEALAQKVVEYFEWSNKYDKGKYTYSGLRLFCGLTRSNLSDYRQKDTAFRDTIEHIETVLEDYYEKKLGWAGSTQGAIFWLKNKAGWKDESTQNQNITNVKANFGSDVVQSAPESGADTSGDK